MEMNRRTLAKGAAWAAPVVVASAAVPAYAASTEPCSTGGSFTAPAPTDENGKTTNWTVPAGVNSICFTVLGGAGGGYTRQAPGGAGAQLTGVLPVKPGDILTLVVGSGGSIAEGFDKPSVGGKGYGDGGDSVGTLQPGAFTQQGGSGGAGSAILLNGQPVVIAGGGGGTGGFARDYAAPDGYKWNGVAIHKSNRNTTHPIALRPTRQQAAGSAGGANVNASRFFWISYSLQRCYPW